MRVTPGHTSYYKILVFVLLFLVLPLNSYEQLPKALKAYELAQNGKVEKAQKKIDKVLKAPAAQQMADCWYYKSQIYHLAAQQEISTTPLKSNYLIEAKNAFEKIQWLNNTNQETKDLSNYCKLLRYSIQKEGVELYKKALFEDCARLFENSISISTNLLGETDSFATYYCAIAYQQAGALTKAVPYFRNCLKYNYMSEEVYSQLYATYKQLNENQLSSRILAEGLLKFPKSSKLQIHIVNEFIEKQDYQGALHKIDELLFNDPQNVKLLYSKANIKENLGYPPKEFLAGFGEVLKLEKDHFDANYSIGAYYYNLAVDLFNQSIQEDIPTQTNDKEIKAYFEQALPYLKTAYLKQPDDKTTQAALLQTYMRLDRLEEYKALKEQTNSSHQ